MTLWLMLALAMGCGEDGGSSDAGAGGAGGSTGGAGAAGETGGVSGAAGAAGTGGTAGEELTLGLLPYADLCMPGEYIYSEQLICQGALPAGVPMPQGTGSRRYDSIELPAPMVPGQPYALSTERSVAMQESAPWEERIWGVMSQCGSGGETADLLDEKLLDRGPLTYCSTLMPTKAYTHVVIIANQLVSNNALGLSGFGLCPNVTCPNQ